MRLVVGLIVMMAHILANVRGRAKWYLIETEDKTIYDYSEDDCPDVDGRGKYLKVGEKWTDKECNTYICHADSVTMTKCVPGNQDYLALQRTLEEGCPSEGKIYKKGEKWTTKDCQTFKCEDEDFGLVSLIFSPLLCNLGEKSVTTQYPECEQKCVPDPNFEGLNITKGPDGCSNVGGSGKFLKVGEKWTAEDCTTYKCEGKHLAWALPPAQFRCADGEKPIQPQYPECGVQKCVPDNEGSHGNNEDDGVQCSEGKNPDGTCMMYTITVTDPPDSFEDDSNQ